MFWTLAKLHNKLCHEGFIEDASRIREAMIAVEGVLRTLSKMKDDGLKITDEEITSIRNEWNELQSGK